MKMSDVWIHPDIAYFLGPQGVSPQTVRDAYQNTLCSPGLGAEASTSRKPLISAAAEMSGFRILYIQMHCLHRYKTVMCLIIPSIIKSVESAVELFQGIGTSMKV